MDNHIPISSKAKGKGRAYPINMEALEMRNVAAPVRSLQLGVRFTDGSPDLRFTMTPQDTGETVLVKIRQERPELQQKRLKLIHAGRLILDHSVLGTLQKPSVISPTESRLSLSNWSKKEKTEPKPENEEPVIWLHCSVGEIIENEQTQDGTETPTRVEVPNIYDRFTDAGLSQADVQTIRSLFRRMMFGNGASNAENERSLSAAQINRLETEWLESISQPSAFEEPSSSAEPPAFLSYLLPSATHASPARSTTQGLLFGFFFPFISNFMVRPLYRPAAFFDGEIWPNLNSEVAAVASALAVIDTSAQQNRENTSNDNAPTADVTEPGEGSTNAAVASDDPVESQREEARSTTLVADAMVDPIPNLTFTDIMHAAVRAGMMLNVVIGLYLWLYA